MSEYINRDEAYQRLHDAGGCGATDEWSKGYDDGITEAIRIINEMSAADVVPVVRCYECERFIPFIKDERGFCSEHHIRAYPIGYCSNGAKMDESEETE